MLAYALPLTSVAPFVLIPLLLAALLISATAFAYRNDAAALKALVVTGLTAGWLALTWAVAASGVLRLVQAFRLPLELAMHGMYERGVMPVQMTYTGRNFDIVTGASAILVALLAKSKGRRGLVMAWNVMGLGLVLNVVIVAILATPRFRFFGDDHLNVWVTYPPFVWLPAVMVLAAFAGHLVIFRALSTGAVRS